MENRAIADPLLRFVENHENGLFIGGFPTGIGKTHQCCWMMLEALRREPETKFLFITDQRKNLPEEQLWKIARDEFGIGSEEFGKTVLVMKSNVDSFVERFTPDIQVRAREAFRNYDQSVEVIDSVLSDMRAYKRSADIHDARHKEFIHDRFADSEREFRKALRKILNNYCNKEQRIRHIREDADLNWIPDLYPSVFFDEYPIVMMTVKKFMYDIDTLVSAPFTIWLETDLDSKDGTSRLRERTVIIDEFDTAKGEFMDVIVESRKGEVDALRAFRFLSLKLSTWRMLPRRLVEQTEWWDKYRSRNSIEQRFERIVGDSERINGKFHMDYLFRMTERDGNSSGSSFLFKDYEPYTVGTAFTMKSDDEERYNYIFTGDRVASQSNWFSILFSEIDGFFNRFAKLVRDLAFNFQYVEEPDRDKGSFKDCVMSVLDAFDLDGDFHDFILGKVLHNRLKSRNDRKFDLAEPTVYSRGFSYISLRDSKERMLQTHLYFTEFDITPEMILRHLCESTEVIGLSATGTIDTPVSNFCLGYLRQVGVNIFEMTDPEMSGIRALMDSKQHGFLTGESEVSVEEIGPAGEYSVDCWEELFGDLETAEAVYRMASPAGDDSTGEVGARYFRLAEAVGRFLELDDVRSMICFFSAHIKSSADSGFRRETAQYIISKLVAKKCMTCSFIWSEDRMNMEIDGSDVFIVQVTGDDFEDRTALVSELLSRGKKVLVLTAYQTLGAGQNIQYEVPMTDEGNLVWIRDDDPSGYRREKDFDAIYLDKPTSVVSPVEFHDKASLDRYLFFVESMDASNQILMEDKRRQVGQAFRSCYSPNNGVKIKHFKETPGYRLAAARVIIQALGRLSRTGWKPRTVHILADRGIRSAGIFSMPLSSYGEFGSFEFGKLYETLHQTEDVPIDERLITDSAVRLSHNLMRLIDDMRYSVYGGDANAISTWKKWRELVLRYPVMPYDTAGMTGFDRQAFMYGYVGLPEPAEKYWFSTKTDFESSGTDGLKISFRKPQSGPDCIWYSTDPETSGLELMLEVDGVREFMESMGYSTCFGVSSHLMSPPLFRNIYMGALGEVIGRFILEREGIHLNEVDNRFYEMFDYVTDSGCFVDFKNWKGNIVEDPEKTEREYDRIASKLEKCNGDTAYIVNVVVDDADLYKPVDTVARRGKTIVLIPYLYGRTHSGDRFNDEAIKTIRRNGE